jgi:hypothetical protein
MKRGEMNEVYRLAPPLSMNKKQGPRFARGPCAKPLPA